MLVGILSDTHIVDIADGYQLAEQLLEGPFANVSVIIHAGDHIHPDLSSCFAPLSFFSVCGNMDVASCDRPLKRILSIAGKRIGVVHGWGCLENIEERVMHAFEADEVDVIVFGHSHMPLCKQVGSVLLFNPGSATDRRSAAFHSVGLLNIGLEVMAEVVAID
jgi:putative phosphoesterase